MGVRFNDFDYSAKKLCTEDSMEKERYAHIRKMKNSLARTNSNWNTINRPDDVYYSLDLIVGFK